MAVTIAGSGTVTGVDPDSFETGLRHIVTKDFSAVSSVSVDNCFTSEFDNYRVLVSGYASAAADMEIRLRDGGVDDSGSNYVFQRMRAADTTVTANRETANKMDVGVFRTTDYSSSSVDIFSPALARPTGFVTTANDAWETTPIAYFATGTHRTTSTFDGFTLLPASGTITGTLRVYGYMNGVAS